MSEHVEVADDTVASDDRWSSDTRDRTKYLGFLLFFLRRRNAIRPDLESFFFLAAMRCLMKPPPEGIRLGIHATLDMLKIDESLPYHPSAMRPGMPLGKSMIEDNSPEKGDFILSVSNSDFF